MAGTVPTFDYETQAANIARKRKIVEAMQASAMQGVQQPQQAGVPVATTQLLAPMIKAYMAKKRGEKLDTEQADLTSRYAGDLKTGMEAFARTSQGYHVDQMGGVPAADVAGDPKAAVLQALSSTHPVLQNLGMEMLKEQAKGALTAKDLAGMATPESVLKNPNNQKSWLPQRKLTEVQPGVPLVDTGGNFATPGPQPSGEPAFKTTTINGDLYQETPTGLKKLDNAPKTTVNTTVQNGDNAFDKTMGELNAKQIDEALKTASTAQQTLDVVGKLRAIDKQGVFSGPTANIAQGLGAFAQTLGIPVDAEKLARGQGYNAILSQQIASYLTAGAGVGRSLTDSDRQALEKQFPQLINTPEGRQKIFGILEDAANKRIAFGGQLRKNLQEQFPELHRQISVMPSATDFNSPGGGAKGTSDNPYTPEELQQLLKGGQ